jgi:Arc/MetJ family transcription regulator
MSKQPTTIRLDQALHREVLREARKAGLSFSSVVHLLLRAFTQGTVQIGVTQYPAAYLTTLGKEADALRRLHRKGKAKGYPSSKALFDDLLGR